MYATEFVKLFEMLLNDNIFQLIPYFFPFKVVSNK